MNERQPLKHAHVYDGNPRHRHAYLDEEGNDWGYSHEHEQAETPHQHAKAEGESIRQIHEEYVRYLCRDEPERLPGELARLRHQPRAGGNVTFIDAEELRPAPGRAAL